MKHLFLATLAKTISFASKLTNIGSGSTWPGHIALGLEKNYIKKLLKNSPTKIILIAGTNGKTTTGKILTTILSKNKKKVFQNSSGANLLNGIASSLLLHSNALGKLTADYAIFEVDENNLHLILEEITPKAIIVLDLFRDQLDRYGELDSIAKKWQEALGKLPSSTQLILNADDPLIAYLGLSLSQKANSLQKSYAQRTEFDKGPSVSYFGLDQTTQQNSTLQHAADSLYCPQCNNKLHFQKVFYSHLGVWKCLHCKLERPVPNFATAYYPLEGTYNKYNTLAASLTAYTLGLSKESVEQSLSSVTPAFGRQEKLVKYGKKVQIFLSKNPTGFNESLRTIAEKKAKYVMLVLNDRIPDGRDISWIWDIDLEEYIEKFQAVVVSGDRCWDMMLRITYSMQFPIADYQFSKNALYEILNTKYFIDPHLKQAINAAIEQTPKEETLYILPTYSAMLEVRKILTGRKIL